MKKSIISKAGLVFFLVLGATVVGFGLSLFVISAIPSLKPSQVVLAREKIQDQGNGKGSEESLQNILSLQGVLRRVTTETLPVIVELDVASITKRSVPRGGAPFRGFPWDFFFDSPDGSPDGGEEKKREFRNEGLGSGILIRRERDKHYVLTNAHVVNNADEIIVKLNDSRDYEGKVVGIDSRKDTGIVVFETKERDIPVARLGDSDTLHVGDFVLAIGSPFGFQSSVTFGIVSALGRVDQAGRTITDFIQTDAAVNRGNSGGALVNLNGEVIGINTWISTSTGQNAGLAFSIPINNVKRPIEDLISTGKVSYGWLGIIMGSTLDEELNIELGVPLHTKGALIGQIVKKSPAAIAGLLPGDVITSLGNLPIANNRHLLNAVGDSPAGSTISISVLRQKQKRSFSVKLTSRKADISAADAAQWPGMGVTPLSVLLRKKYQVSKGVTGVVVYSVSPKSPVSVVGLREGDLLTHVNQNAITNMGDFFRLINTSRGKKITLSYLREGAELATPLFKL